MSPPVTMNTLHAGQQVMIERVENLKSDLNTKHSQNRKDIHDIKGEVEDVKNQIWMLKLKLAAYAAGGSIGGGSIAAVIIKIVEHYWKT